MELKNQVVSLELSKKLKLLNFKQESLFCWTELNGDWFIYYVDRDGGFSIPKSSEEKFISAYTVAEIKEILPSGHSTLKMTIGNESTMVTYYEVELNLHKERDENEANAGAKMLIYLKNNNLI